MQADIDEKTGEEQTEQNVIGTPSELDPFYAVRKKKKRKKKKPFPTDPDDPETDEDFEEDDDDDDDTEPSGDTEGSEDENELVQEVQKPITVQKDPFLNIPQQPENIDLKRQIDNPNKKQRSPLQKFFDVLLYGIQGAKLRNGDLSVKNSMFDELLLGLGFKAYLKDVLLNNQLVKYFKQKTKGKDDMTFLQKMFKSLKKRINKDSELKSILPDLQKKVVQAEKKSLTSVLEKEVQKKALNEGALPQNKDIIQILKTPQRPAKVGAPVAKKENIAFTKEEAKKILLAVEKEEQRLKEEEKRFSQATKLNAPKISSKKEKKSSLVVEQSLKIKETHKLQKEQEQKALQMNERANIQAEKDQMMAQRVAAPVIPVSIVVSQADKDYAMQQQLRTAAQQETSQLKPEAFGQVAAKLVEIGLAKGMQELASQKGASPLGNIVRAAETSERASRTSERETTLGRAEVGHAEATTVRVDDKGQATKMPEQPQRQAPDALSGASRAVPTSPNDERVPPVDKGRSNN